MVLTAKEIKRQKAIPIVYAETNPDRLHMSKAEVLAEKAKKAKIDCEVEKFREDLIKKQKELEGKEAGVDDRALQGIETPLAQEVIDKIVVLKKKLAEEKGPGSNVRKKKLQDQIDGLNK